MELYAPDWELSFYVPIVNLSQSSKVGRIAMTDTATNANIARSILLATTHTKPIFLTLITDQRWIGQSQHDTNVVQYDLSTFFLVYSQGILSVALLAVAV